MEIRRDGQSLLHWSEPKTRAQDQVEAVPLRNHKEQGAKFGHCDDQDNTGEAATKRGAVAEADAMCGSSLSVARSSVFVKTRFLGT